MLHQLLSNLGIFWAKHRYMPHGINWLVDLKRFPTIAPAPLVLDVGANVGQTTHDVLQAFPRATVHSFEPVKATFEKFKHRFGITPSVHCNHLAISDTCGQATMVAAADSQHSHLARPSDDISHRAPHLESIKTMTIDSYCAQQGINHIDILKTDTEGHDFAVLVGAESALKAGKINWILTEVTFDPSDTTHTLFDTVYHYLRDYDMSVYSFYDHGYTKGCRRHLFCNVLFVRSGFAAQTQ
jgi:FkbM family methyltransferase